ncbi:MAG: Hpt domain-containing protein [Oscillospiraceae bacterium]
MNNIILEKLSLWGCDVQGALERCVNDENFYIDCLQSFKTDINFEQLKINLENKNFEAAFEAAHSLKGVSANLGITPLFDSISILVERLRKGYYEDNQKQYDAIYHDYQYLLDILK